MGYRHQVISDITYLTKDKLPGWFTIKYDKIIDFDRQYWASYGECKRYFALVDFNTDIQKVSLVDFNTDIQKVLNELELWITVRLIYFADESSELLPDVIHTTITADIITEIAPDRWVEID